MALPVAPPPRSNDVAIVGWAGITVRIAWTLLILGVKVRPEVLREVRAHVLYHLDPATPLPHAEDMATHLTEAWVARVRGKPLADPWPVDWEMPISPRWRRALDRALDPVAQAVFRKHYGDNRGVSRLETSLDIDRVSIEAIQAGLREVVRRVAVSDGLPLDGWPPQRIDRLLRRLAAWSPGPCPPVLDVAEGCHREHVASCARCDRIARLVRSNVLEVDDLFPPSVGARPTQRTRAVVLQLHPEARAHRSRLLRELSVPAFPLEDDRIVFDAALLDEATPLLKMATEVELPARHQLRGAIVEGPGSWSPRGLIGPLSDRGAREVLHRSWGTVDQLGELPHALPEPPSARGWWAASVSLGLVGALIVGMLVAAPTAGQGQRLDARFVEGRGGWWASFDVPDEELVYVVGEEAGALVVALQSEGSADKVDLSTGDGSYRVHLAGRGALVASSPRPVPDFDLLVARAQGAPDPLGTLASELDGTAAVRWVRADVEQR
ncbi:MAG: hypothetical protein KC621_17125 [Myxococcales bacterium]|nr:hypothetical protein [Myxococcales bacterium]